MESQAEHFILWLANNPVCYEHATTIKSLVLDKAERCPGAFLTAGS
jgi:hypothetical protein